MGSGLISKQEAAKEVYRRKLARKGLMAFTQYTYPEYKADPVHHLIASKLDDVRMGLIRRLMIFAPPQHGKSELTSVRFPALCLGDRPNDPIVLSSYGASLAESKSRQARAVVESIEYSRLFGRYASRNLPPVETRSDSRAVDNWLLNTPYRGGMLAVGVGGPVTGHGGLFGLIDDPHENWEQAQSRTYRERVWDWYRATFRTRIWEGGAIVLIMTRWHENDLAGMLLAEQADEWTVLRLPALAETQEERDANNLYLGLPIGQPDPLGREAGEALSPSRFSKEELLRIKRDIGIMAWTSEYQGVPRSAEGNRFKRAWFEIVDSAPIHAKRIRYWDKAGTAYSNGNGKSAATAGVLIAMTDDGMIYIEDVVRGWYSALERERVIKQTAELDAMKYGAGKVRIFIEQEPGSGGKESAEATIRNLAGHSVYADRPTGDKDTRLEPFAAQTEAGNVKLVRGGWNHDYIEEMVAIPNGMYRDQADATAGAFNKLAEKKEIGYVQAKWR